MLPEKRPYPLAVHHPLATAPTPPPSVCHCTPRPCNRKHVAYFCMSLRTSAHTGVAIRVPAENPGNLVLLQANPLLFRIHPKYSLSLCATAGVTDCPVASLLAMTCNNLLPVHIIPGHCRCAAGKAGARDTEFASPGSFSLRQKIPLAKPVGIWYYRTNVRIWRREQWSAT